MENILSFDGYTYNIETREITFTQKVCWNCKGNKLAERGVLCPRNGRKQRGKACEHCGSRSADNHKSVGKKWAECHTCEGTGTETCDDYSSLDMSALLEFINIVSLDGLRSASFNESYLGRGIIGGCTDYGRYLNETDGTIESVIAYARRESVERNSHTQALNLIDKDNRLITTAVLKMNRDGWSLFSVDGRTSLYCTK